MPESTDGQEARSAAVERAAQAADSLKTDEFLPLSADDLEGAPEVPETDGEKKHREILRELAGKKKKSAGDEPDAEDDDDETEAGETEATAAQADKPANPSAKGNETSEMQLSAAKDALIRDGWTSADLEKLPPERVIELGTKRQSQQKQQDGFGRQKHEEIADLRKRLAELEGTPGAGQPQTAAAQTQTPATTSPSAAGDQALEPIMAELDKLGEYASPEVKDVVKKSLTAMYQSLSQKMQQAYGGLAQTTEHQLVQSARSELTEKYPALADEAKFGKADAQGKTAPGTVLAKMRALAQTGDYGAGDMKALMEDACRLVLPAPSIQDVQRKMLEGSRKAQQGQMDAGQTVPRKDKEPSQEDRSRQILRAMKKGKSPEEARRAAMAR